MGSKTSDIKVSIIIPYDVDRGYLQETIDSVKAQTFDGRIELILSQSDNKVGYNINRGVERATGDYIKFCASDDILTPNCIQDSVDAMIEGGYDFIHANAINFFEDGREEKWVPKIKIPTIESMIDINGMHGGTLFYTKEVWDRLGYFDEGHWTGEEYEFNLRLLSKGAKVGYLNKFVFRYRRHAEQKSLGNKDAIYQNERAKEIERICAKYRK